MSNTDFNILIGVDMSNAEGTIKESIKGISEGYPLKLNLIIGNQDKFIKQIENIRKLFSSIGNIDTNFGLDGNVRDIENINGKLRQMANIDMSDVGGDLAKSLEQAKKKLDEVRNAYQGLMNIVEKRGADGSYFKTEKIGDRFKSRSQTTGMDSNKHPIEKAPIDTRNFEALNNFVDKAMSKIDTLGNVTKANMEDVSLLTQRIAMLHVKLTNGDAGFNDEIKDIQNLIEHYSKMENKMVEANKAREKQVQEAIKWSNKLADVERKNFANPASRKKMSRLVDELGNGEFDNLDKLKKKLQEVSLQYAKIQEQEKSVTFGRKVQNQYDNITKKTLDSGKLQDKYVDPKDKSKLQSAISGVKQAENELALENALKRVNAQYDKMLADQAKAIINEKEQVKQAEELLTLQKHLAETENERARMAHDSQVRQYEIARRTGLVDDKTNEINQMKSKMIGSGLVDRKAFDQVEDKIREIGKLAKSEYVENLDIEKELQGVDRVLAKISERYTELEEKTRRVRVNIHDWNNEIEKIKSNGFVNENEFDGIRKNMRNLSAESKTYEQDLKRIQTQISRMNTLNEKRAQRQETIDISKDKNNAKIDSMKGIVPDNILNEIKGLNNLVDFASSKKDLALIESEMKKLVQLENEIKTAGKEESKIRAAIANHTRQAVKSTDKYNDTVAEIVHNTIRQVSDIEKRNNVEREAINLQRQLNELKSRGTELSDEEHRSIQQRILALRQLAQRQKDIESQENNRKKITQQFADKVESVGYRATRGMTANASDTIKLRETVAKIRDQVEGLGDLAGNEFNQATESIQKQLNDLNKASRTIRDNDQRRRDSLGGQLANAMKKVPIWTAAMGVVYGTIRQVKEGFQSILEIDKAMINLAKVSEGGKKQLENFKFTASGIGRELGVVASEVIKATTEFQKLGYTLEQSTTLGKNSILYANVGDMSIEDASANLISTIKGFGVEVDIQGNNVRNLVDMFNEVGNNFAITSEGIGEALKRSSSVMHEAGNTIQDTVGLITAANAVTQDPKKVGNALKTVAMRLRGVTEEGEVVEELLPKLQNTFDRINKEFGLIGEEAVNVMEKDKVTFKSTYDIFEEVVKIWDKLSDLERANLVETMGGKHQGVVVSAIIQNWEDAKNASETASNSAGSAVREFSAYMEGFEYKIGQLKNAVERFWTTLVDSDAVKGMVDALTSIVDALTWVTDTFGATPIVALMGGFLSILGSRAVRETIVSLKLVGTAFQGLATWMGRVVGFVPRLIPFLGVVMAIGVAVSALYKIFTAASRARKERLKVLDAEISKLKEYKKSYEETFEQKDFNLDDFGKLQAKGSNRSTEEEEKYLNVVAKIKDEMPELISFYNERNEAVIKSTDEIRKLTKAKEDLLLLKETEQFDVTMDDTKFKDFNKKMAKVKESYEQLSSTEGTEKLQSVAKEFLENETRAFDSSNYIDVVNDFRQKIYEAHSQLAEEEKKYNHLAFQGLLSIIPTSKDTGDALSQLELLIENNKKNERILSRRKR